MLFRSISLNIAIKETTSGKPLNNKNPSSGIDAPTQQNKYILLNLFVGFRLFTAFAKGESSLSAAAGQNFRSSPYLLPFNTIFTAPIVLFAVVSVLSKNFVIVIYPVRSWLLK